MQVRVVVQLYEGLGVAVLLGLGVPVTLADTVADGVVVGHRDAVALSLMERVADGEKLRERVPVAVAVAVRCGLAVVVGVSETVWVGEGDVVGVVEGEVVGVGLGEGVGEGEGERERDSVGRGSVVGRTAVLRVRRGWKKEKLLISDKRMLRLGLTAKVAVEK